MFLAERRAAERLVDERRLADYAKRFAFVAHDVKTVSSQLSLLLANAEENLADPEFQHDMLVTVRASAARINALIVRLGQPGDVPAADRDEAVAPLERLRALAAAKPYPVRVEGEAAASLAAIGPARFDTAVGHLMNNAAEASPPGEPVRVRVAQEGHQLVVEVTDRGAGMSPEFIRDELFRPLSTSKRQGSGIGAWQARELLREAGGDLAVLSRPGAGTTMRILLPVSAAAAAPPAPLPIRGAA
jgi:signal transduction histidine kinase